MSKATATVVKGSQVKTPKPPTVASVEKRIAEALAKYGSPDQAASAGVEASQTLTRSQEALRAWFLIAAASVKSGQSGVAFGKAVGGNNNSRTRLLRAQAVLDAGRKAGHPVPFWRAVAVGNGPVKGYNDVISAFAKGDNPFAGEKHTASGKRAKGTATTKRVQTVVAPDRFAEVVRFITANVDKIATAHAREDLHKAALALVQATAPAAKRTPKPAAAKRGPRPVSEQATTLKATA